MNSYVYQWTMQPEAGLTLDLRVRAPSAAVARREIRRFLDDHDGVDWRIERISREASFASHAPLVVPPARLS